MLSTDLAVLQRREPVPPPQPMPTFRFEAAASPWRRSHHLFAVVLTTVGTAVAAWAWFRISGENTLRQQSGWIVLSMLAGGLFGVGLSGWLLVGFREVRRGEREFVSALRAQRVYLKERQTAARAVVHHDGDLLTGTGTGMTRVHRAGCRLLRGKPVSTLGAEEAERLGLRPCGVCAP